MTASLSGGLAGLTRSRRWVIPEATIDLDLANGRYFGGTVAGSVTLTRASAGTADDSLGDVLSFASGALRQTTRGLLIEASRTNLVLQSAALATTPWATAGASVTVAEGAALAPDGTTTATRITAASGGNRDTRYHQQAVAVSGGTSGKQFTFSIWLRSANGSTLRTAVRKCASA